MFYDLKTDFKRDQLMKKYMEEVREAYDRLPVLPKGWRWRTESEPVSYDREYSNTITLRWVPERIIHFEDD